MSSSKKPRLILHIGSQKTGTTSIQQFLAKNREYLSTQNIYIPGYLGGNNHRYAVFLAENSDKREDAFTISSGLQNNNDAKKQFKKNLLEKIEAECERKNNKLWIISSEFFQSRLNTNEEVSRLKSILSDLFGEIKIICYLRDPLSTAISTWSTYVMSGGIAQNLPAPKTIFHNNCDHKSLVSRWEKVFNQQEIIFRNYSRNQLINKDIINDFCYCLKINLDNRVIYPKKRNSSLSYKGILILSKINSLTQNIRSNEKNQIRRIISKVIHKNFQDFPIYLPTKVEINEYDKAYSESFKWVSLKYFNNYTSINELYTNKFRGEADNNYIDELTNSDKHFINAMLDMYKLHSDILNKP